ANRLSTCPASDARWRSGRCRKHTCRIRRGASGQSCSRTSPILQRPDSSWPTRRTHRLSLKYLRTSGTIGFCRGFPAWSVRWCLSCQFHTPTDSERPRLPSACQKHFDPAARSNCEPDSWRPASRVAPAAPARWPSRQPSRSCRRRLCRRRKCSADADDLRRRLSWRFQYSLPCLLLLSIHHLGQTLDHVQPGHVALEFGHMRGNLRAKEFIDLAEIFILHLDAILQIGWNVLLK